MDHIIFGKLTDFDKQSIIVFMIYISYDIQKIDRLMTTNIPEENIAIMGAFNLYLDFINIFINLLKIFGKNRD